ncbi:hypothetical protein LL037_21245 [Clostridium estertheticum]|nr:hypothetical protein [Clostridium estertheticum]MCB2354408.1 hypothetical protein [Clostridium estertheticum]WAG68102.1 hypothetical protein LL037_21245 [Clostridium estertheticum]
MKSKHIKNLPEVFWCYVV